MEVNIYVGGSVEMMGMLFMASIPILNSSEVPSHELSEIY